MKKIKTHKFNNVSYKIGLDDPYVGWCDKPKRPQKNEYPAIRLPEGLPSGEERGAKSGLINLLHECLHAENWNKREKVIDRTAVEIGNLLWRLGYRRGK